jgi:hypothetical protein
MNMKQETPLYENGRFWVRRAQFGSGRFKPKSNGYEVYESGITHSVRRAIIGFEGERGLSRAIAEADRLASGTQGGAS